MTRTTIDLDATVLRELKKRQRREGKSLGRLVSEMLSAALDQDEPEPDRPFAWVSRPMDPTIDIEDKEQLRRALDEA